MKHLIVESSYPFRGHTLVSGRCPEGIEIGDVLRCDPYVMTVTGFGHVRLPTFDRDHVELVTDVSPETEIDELTGLEFIS